MRIQTLSCAHCNKPISGSAEINGGLILHADCAPAYRAAARGLSFRCPSCNGSGWEYNRDVHEVETYDPADGFNGWGGPLATRVVSRHESKRCALCDGNGFLAKEPTPIIQPAVAAKVVGWRK